MENKKLTLEEKKQKWTAKFEGWLDAPAFPLSFVDDNVNLLFDPGISRWEYMTAKIAAALITKEGFYETTPVSEIAFHAVSTAKGILKEQFSAENEYEPES